MFLKESRPLFRLRLVTISLDRIYRIYILNFQFPEETENTQSPPANKIGKYNLVIKETNSSRGEKTSQNY